MPTQEIVVFVDARPEERRYGVMAFLRASHRPWLAVLPADRLLGLLAAVGGSLSNHGAS